MKLLLAIKRLLQSFGYDVRRRHSLYDTILKHRSIRTIIDIGANDGVWSAEMRVLFPEAHIYAFEPLPDCYRRLMERFKSDARFQAFPVALGNKDGDTEMERSSFHPSSSLRKMAALHKRLYPKSAVITREKITMRRLDGLIPDLELSPGILVKIDVQGYEDKVIEGGRELLHQADVLIVETSFVRLYEGQPLFGDIHDALRALGFSYCGSAGEHFSRETGERIYEDSIYVREKR